MIERLTDVPEGTVGFHASGKISADDYRDVLEPDLTRAAESGEVRMLFILDPDFGVSAGAVAQDTKLGLGIGYGHHSAWKRSAVVTDVEWVVQAFRAFAWMVPGELKVFPTSELEEAKSWVSG
jgi:hypothetical protein